MLAARDTLEPSMAAPLAPSLAQEGPAQQASIVASRCVPTSGLNVLPVARVSIHCAGVRRRTVPFLNEDVPLMCVSGGESVRRTIMRQGWRMVR